MKQNTSRATIARNRRARFDYHIQNRYEAGLVLEGWELKSIRAGQVQLSDAFVTIRDGEAYLHNASIAPLASASSHVTPDPDRTRKLLLHTREIAEIFRTTRLKGKSCVALSMYWKHAFVKCEIATVEGKKKYDKRKTIRDREYQRSVQQTLRKS